MADAIQIVDVLADQELDYIHVSLNNFFSRPRRGVESNKSRMEILKELVGNRTPLIGVGEITTPQQAAAALSSGVELVALGRALLLDPNWLSKVQEGREDQIKNKLFHRDLPELLFIFLEERLNSGKIGMKPFIVFIMSWSMPIWQRAI